jgi:tripartite-type tricarboxylate transporter receptor subunit TctC
MIAPAHPTRASSAALALALLTLGHDALAQRDFPVKPIRIIVPSGAGGGTDTTARVVAPDIPTIAEQGVPGYEAVQWYGLMAPAGTPKEVIARLHKAAVFALQDAVVRERLIEGGADPVGNTPEEFAALVRAEVVKWAKVVKAAGIRAE